MSWIRLSKFRLLATEWVSSVISYISERCSFDAGPGMAICVREGCVYICVYELCSTHQSSKFKLVVALFTVMLPAKFCLFGPFD
jgi:hypothetical protein